MIFFYWRDGGEERRIADRVSFEEPSRVSLSFSSSSSVFFASPFLVYSPFRGMYISASRITRSIVSRAVGVFTTGVMRVYAASAFRIACVQEAWWKFVSWTASKREEKCKKRKKERKRKGKNRKGREEGKRECRERTCERAWQKDRTEGRTSEKRKKKKKKRREREREWETFARVSGIVASDCWKFIAENRTY